MKPIYVYEDGDGSAAQYEIQRRLARLRRTREMIIRLSNVLGAKGEAGYELVRSMIQREFRFNEAHKFTAILQRRVRLAKDKGLSVTIFKGVSIDASIADEIALVQSYCNQSGGTGAAGANSARVKDSLETIKETQAELGGLLINTGKVLNEINANTRPRTPPRASDREVHQELAAEILTEVGYSVSTRQVQNWERHINTRGEKGTKPPEGYSIELRNKYLDFIRWAEMAAKERRMKRAVAGRRRKEHKTNA